MDILTDVAQNKLTIKKKTFELLLAYFVKNGSETIKYECVKEGFIRPIDIYENMYILVNYTKVKLEPVQYYYYLLVKLFYNIIIKIRSLNIKILHPIQYNNKTYYVFNNSMFKYYDYLNEPDFNPEYYHIDDFIFTKEQYQGLQQFYKV